MSTAVIPSPIREVIGDALSPLTLNSSTKQYITVEPGFHEVMLYSASQFKLLLNPKIEQALKYTVLGGFSRSETALQDKVATVAAMAVGGLLTTGFLYFATQEQISGLNVTMKSGDVNANVATLKVEYWNGTAWADTSASDGTTSAGATLAQSGAITWSVPAAELPLFAGILLGNDEYFGRNQNLYWYRVSVSATLSATVNISEMNTINKGTNYALIEAAIIHSFSVNTVRVGCLQVLSVSATPVLDIDWVKH